MAETAPGFEHDGTIYVYTEGSQGDPIPFLDVRDLGLREEDE